MGTADSTATDNRIVRMPLIGTSGSYRLGSVAPILTALRGQGDDKLIEVRMDVA